MQSDKVMLCCVYYRFMLLLYYVFCFITLSVYYFCFFWKPKPVAKLKIQQSP